MSNPELNDRPALTAQHLDVVVGSSARQKLDDDVEHRVRQGVVT